jgi:hypothetical protein
MLLLKMGLLDGTKTQHNRLTGRALCRNCRGCPVCFLKRCQARRRDIGVVGGIQGRKMGEHETASRAGLVCRSPPDSRNRFPDHCLIQSEFYAWEAIHLDHSHIDNYSHHILSVLVTAWAPIHPRASAFAVKTLPSWRKLQPLFFFRTLRPPSLSEHVILSVRWFTH